MLLEAKIKRMKKVLQEDPQLRKSMTSSTPSDILRPHTTKKIGKLTSKDLLSPLWKE